MAGAASSAGAGGDFGEFGGIDPSLDPELALVCLLHFFQREGLARWCVMYHACVGM